MAIKVDLEINQMLELSDLFDKAEEDALEGRLGMVIMQPYRSEMVAVCGYIPEEKALLISKIIQSVLNPLPKGPERSIDL